MISYIDYWMQLFVWSTGAEIGEEVLTRLTRPSLS